LFGLGGTHQVYSLAIDYNAYDQAGRVTKSTQTTGGVPYAFSSYGYNMLDGLTSETYPSGRAVQYAYDNGGRVKTVAGTLNSVVTNYAGTTTSPITYASHHAVLSLPMGNGITEAWSYNPRLQATGVQAGSLMTLGFSYSGTQNNGNVLGETITRGGQTWTESFGYNDGYNRLTSASESGAGTWSEGYTYSATGNRWVSSASGLPPYTVETPQGPSWYSPNNQIGSWNYDAAGNITGLPATGGTTVRVPCTSGLPGGGMLRTACYDAENRMSSETSSNGATTTYGYDGDRRRVTKTTGAFDNLFKKPV